MMSGSIHQISGAVSGHDLAGSKTNVRIADSNIGVSPSSRVVCMLCPGGFEHAGGIGRWAGYLFAAWPNVPRAPRLEVIDTRGHGGVVVAGATFLLALAKLVWLWATGRLGLMHVNLSVRGSTVRKYTVSALAWWAGVPVIIHLHSGRFPEFYHSLPRWAQSAVRRMFDRAACVIVPGKIWEDMLVRELGVERSNIRVMPNAVAEPPPPPPRPLGGECHIVMLGRMGPPKGLPELMEALGSPQMRGLSWRITMAGDGDPDTYRKDAVARGIADKVSIVGWLDGPQVAALLASADVLVLPSRSENLPVAVIEALSYGVAVVTTPVGAIPEIVQNEVSALLVPVQDPAALATALSRLVADPRLRSRIGKAGHDAFLARLEIGQCAQTLALVYDRLMQRGLPAQHVA
jgi:glycosyltransferase involved in cell wall biosynthesis